MRPARRWALVAGLGSLLATCAWVGVQLHAALADSPLERVLPGAPGSSPPGAPPGASDGGALPRPLQGILRDLQGRPIAGVSVFLSPAARAQPPLGACTGEDPCSHDPREAPLERLLAAIHGGQSFSQAEEGTRTAVDGTWQLQPRAPAPWTFWADDGARGALVEPFDEDAAGGSHDLTLLPLQVVEGRVTDADERPLAGAHVHLVGDRLRMDTGAVTDGDGHYRVALPHEGFTAVAHADGYAPQRRTPPTGDQDLDFALDRLHRCRVTVTRDGRPVTARLHVLPGPELPARVVDVPETGVQVELEAGPGLLLRAEDDTSSSRALEPGFSRERACELALVLEPPLQLTVQVGDERGSPLESIPVTLEGEGVELSAQTDASGRALLPPAAPGSYLVRAERPGTEAGRGETVGEIQLSRDGQVLELKLRSERQGCSLEGTLVSPEIVSELTLIVGDGNVGQHAHVTAGGHFTVELPCGPVELELYAPNVGRGTWRGNAPAAGVEISLDAGTGLDVRVVSASGPLRGAEVELRPAERAAGRAGAAGRRKWMTRADTDARGRAELRGVEPGEYLLSVSAEHFAPLVPRPLRLEAGRTDTVEVTLDRGLPLRGRVVDDRGRPVREVEVSAKAEGCSACETASATSRRDGSFELPNLPRGERYQLEATAPDEAWCDSEQVTATPGDPPVLLALRKPFAVTGRVLDDTGAPLPRFSVNAREKESPGGRFQQDLDCSGPLLLSISAEGFHPRLVTVPPGARDAGDIRLERASELRGTVVDEAGNAVTGARVWAEGGSDEVRSGSDGRFTLRSVTGQLRAEKDGWRAAVEGPPRPEPVTLVLHLPATFSGEAWSAPGTVAREVEVSCFPFAAPGRVVPDERGQFSVQLPPGRCSVRAERLSRVSFAMEGAPVNVSLGPAPGTHALTVAAPEGAPELRITPVPELPGRPRWHVRPDDGVVRVSGLPPGMYELQWSRNLGPPNRWPKLRVQVPAEGIVALPLRR
ncbi:MAG: hypothetical protein RL653_1765 [Pseudomonadota bacterium]